MQKYCEDWAAKTIWKSNRDWRYYQQTQNLLEEQRQTMFSIMFRHAIYERFRGNRSLWKIISWRILALKKRTISNEQTEPN